MPSIEGHSSETSGIDPRGSLSLPEEVPGKTNASVDEKYPWQVAEIASVRAGFCPVEASRPHGTPTAPNL
jgi:hypothetical protein